MADKPDLTTREGVQQHIAQANDDYLSGRRDWAPFLEYPVASEPSLPRGPEVGERHAKVSEIIARGLARIGHEIVALDPETLNLDNAADRAEIARQVITQLVLQLRGFSAETRQRIAEEKEIFA